MGASTTRPAGGPGATRSGAENYPWLGSELRVRSCSQCPSETKWTSPSTPVRQPGSGGTGSGFRHGELTNEVDRHHRPLGLVAFGTLNGVLLAPSLLGPLSAPFVGAALAWLLGNYGHAFLVLAGVAALAALLCPCSSPALPALASKMGPRLSVGSSPDHARAGACRVLLFARPGMVPVRCLDRSTRVQRASIGPCRTRRPHGRLSLSRRSTSGIGRDVAHPLYQLLEVRMDWSPTAAFARRTVPRRQGLEALAGAGGSASMASICPVTWARARSPGRQQGRQVL
jgi:hypothetical protein